MSIADLVQINWTEPAPPNGSCWYHHVIGDAGKIGKILITWKDHKEPKRYDIDALGIFNIYDIESVPMYDSLDEAKQACREHIANIIAAALDCSVEQIKVERKS